MKLRIVTNNKGRFSIERASTIKEEIKPSGLFKSPNYRKTEVWIACSDLSNESNDAFKAMWGGPHLMNLCRKTYDSYESAKAAINDYHLFGCDKWEHVGDIFEK